MIVSNVANVKLYCSKTILGKKEEIILGGIKTTTAYPTFLVAAEFGQSKSKRSSVCPHCGKKVNYKAYRFEFSLRKALKHAGLLIVVSVLLFLLAVLLMAFGGWDVDPAMWYFGVWGTIGFFLGVGLLFFQVFRYLAFYTKNKFKYIFTITGLGSSHCMMNNMKATSWRQLPS